MWIDNVIYAELPDPSKETELDQLLKTFQIYRYSRTCSKYQNKKIQIQLR